eukprot:4419409-Pyramimonas_sp.AAC.1
MANLISEALQMSAYAVDRTRGLPCQTHSAFRPCLGQVGLKGQGRFAKTLALGTPMAVVLKAGKFPR